MLHKANTDTIDVCYIINLSCRYVKLVNVDRWDFGLSSVLKLNGFADHAGRILAGLVLLRVDVSPVQPKKTGCLSGPYYNLNRRVG